MREWKLFHLTWNISGFTGDREASLVGPVKILSVVKIIFWLRNFIWACFPTVRKTSLLKKIESSNVSIMNPIWIFHRIFSVKKTSNCFIKSNALFIQILSNRNDTKIISSACRVSIVVKYICGLRRCSESVCIGCSAINKRMIFFKVKWERIAVPLDFELLATVILKIPSKLNKILLLD